MIGDGMGLTQITAGMYANNNKIILEEFPVVGLHKSYSFDNLVTDSAAGATAFSCGVKSYNGAIGVDADTTAVETILETAEKNGLATGMISTSSITHATPASFICHQKERKMMEENAAEFLNTDIDLFIGGGYKQFVQRSDKRDLSRELKAKGYKVMDYFNNNVEEVELDASAPFAFLTASEEPVAAATGRSYLPAATKKGIRFLDERDARANKGFFLMVEGSQIDWGGHANDANYIITEMLDFDKAISHVLDFAKEDGETLVIVTADHETGGFAINPGSTRDSIVAGFTTPKHTAAMIPVFAYGPGAEAFAGIYENTAIYDKMMEAFGMSR